MTSMAVVSRAKMPTALAIPSAPGARMAWPAKIKTAEIIIQKARKPNVPTRSQIHRIWLCGMNGSSS